MTMKKTVLSLLLGVILMPISAFSQTDTTETIRSKGYVIRPEFYGAVLAEVGYQVNPHVQVSLGGGFEIAENIAVPELVAGLRMYATDTKWTAFFDYHLGLLMVGNMALVSHRVTAGPSYKNLDVGGGVIYAEIERVGTWGLCLTLGYNIRIPSKSGK